MVEIDLVCGKVGMYSIVSFQDGNLVYKGTIVYIYKSGEAFEIECPYCPYNLVKTVYPHPIFKVWED